MFHSKYISDRVSKRHHIPISPRSFSEMSNALKRRRQDDAVPYVFPTEEECGEVVAGAEIPPTPATIACMDACDTLPPDEFLQVSVAIPSPGFWRRGVLVAEPMHRNLTFWVSDNTASFNAAKAEEARTGIPSKIHQFSGISIDIVDDSGSYMTILRMWLPPSCIRLFAEKDPKTGQPMGPAPEEVGITVSSKTLLETLQGVKEYQNMIMYSEWGSNILSIQVVSTAHDSLVIEIPLLAVNANHLTVKNWDMKYDLSMSMSDFKETIKRAANLDSNIIRFEIKRWKEQGLIFVMSAESRIGSLFRAFQVTYVTPLKRNPTAEVQYALVKLNEARTLLAAANKDARTSVALQANVDEAERELKQHLLNMYDTMVVPVDFARPARVCALESDLSVCEAEVRTLQGAIREHERLLGQEMNVADYAQSMDAMSVVEVATSYVDDIRAAPFRKKDIAALKSEYTSYFSVQRLATMLKTPQSSEVQIHLPKEQSMPICLHLNVGGSTDSSSSLIAFVIAPKYGEDNDA